ncbi:uncharacterized protein TNCV_2727761 [Trichonephila clavipes]|nr:uncharacterized protein TNCV_2727761 [Trichonephila clavipes]
MVGINFELVLVDSNSLRALEFWTFHPRSETFNPIAQFTRNIFDIFHPQWSCPVSPCSNYKIIRSCRYSGVKGSAWKGCLDLRFASAWCLEIVCGTIPTPTSARIVERVTVGSTSASRTILRSSFLVVFLVAPDPVFRAWVPSHVHCSQQFLTAHSERSTWPATWHVDQPAVFIPMIRPLSNSLNCEKPLLARLPGMFRLPKSSYNRR